MSSTVPDAPPFIIQQRYTLLEAAEAAHVSGLSMIESAPYLYLAYPGTSAYDMANVLTQVWINQADRTSIRQALSSCIRSDGAPAFTEQQIDDVTRFGYPTITRFEVVCVDTPARCASTAFDAEIRWSVSGAESATLTNMLNGHGSQRPTSGSYGIIVNTTQTYWWRLSAPGIKPASKDIRNDM